MGDGPTRDDVHQELQKLVARSELVAIRIPRRRRPGFRGWFAKHVPAVTRIVRVRPATFGDWRMLDEILPASGVTRWEWKRARAWLALRDAYPVTYDEFCTMFGDVESVERLKPAVEAWDRVNPSFRASVESPVAGSALSTRLGQARDSSVGG